MKKIAILIMILLIPTVLGLNLNIEEQSSENVIIENLYHPATFDIEITNEGPSDSLTFYTYFTSRFLPEEPISIDKGATEKIKLEVYPSENIKPIGHQIFHYYIKGQDETKVNQTLLVNVITLEEAFEIGVEEIDPESKELTAYIHSKVKKSFKDLKVEFSSPFFKIEETINLEPNKREDFIIELNKEDYDKLVAGFYTAKVNLQIENVKAEIESPIKFKEKDLIVESKKDYGLIVNTKIISKTNEGNTVLESEEIIKKNILSRLFTTFSPEPNIVDRQGFSVYYTWDQTINPGESYEIEVKTNWLFPFLIIILIVAIGTLTRYYSSRNLVLRKRVSFLRTKGGEFALKVSIIVKAKEFVEKVNITERLPSLMKIHEKFGIEKPSRVDEKNRKIEWRFDHLEQGETRVLNYILYSKVGVVGKFALPRTSALFEKQGKIMERNSNKTFFVIEQNAIEE